MDRRSALCLDANPNKSKPIPICKPHPIDPSMNLLSLLPFALLAGSALAEQAAATDDSKHCKPACCGCDTTCAKKKVKAQLALYNRYLQLPQNFAALSALIEPEAQLFQVGENCENGTGCCEDRLNLVSALSDLSGVAVKNIIENVELKKNGTVIVDLTAIFSEQNLSSKVYHVRQWWNPTPSCHYLIAYQEERSFACPGIYSSCSSCLITSTTTTT